MGLLDFLNRKSETNYLWSRGDSLITLKGVSKADQLALAQLADVGTRAAPLPQPVHPGTVAESTSVQPRFHTDPDVDSVFGMISSIAGYADNIPDVGTSARDDYMRAMWKQEPLLAGAISSMVQKVLSLRWSITGGRNRTKRFSNVLYNAEDGAGWGEFLTKGVQDYLTQDNGWYFELGFEGSTVDSPVAGIYHLDSSRMKPTNKRDYPAIYMPAVGPSLHPVKMPRGSFVRLTSMTSPDETAAGYGFCAVSRAIKAAKLLMALHNYDAERLSDMPPNGILAVTGLTGRQVREAIKMYKQERQARDQNTFPGVLWLASASGQVGLNSFEFKQLPENFNKEVVVTLYVYTLALAFGVDAREFWPATVTGATKADALIQAQKAKGKGPGELITAIERAMNFYVLPEGLKFKFAFQDDEEDRLAAEIAGMRIFNANNMVSGGYLAPENALALLVSQDVLPEVIAAPIVESSDDIEGHKTYEHDPPSHVRYSNGALSEAVLLHAPVPRLKAAPAAPAFLPCATPQTGSRHVTTVEVTQEAASAVAQGSELLVIGDSLPSDDIDMIAVTCNNKLYARALLQEVRAVNGTLIAVLCNVDKFWPPVEV